MSKVRIVLWNVGWRRPASDSGRELHRRIMECSPDVVILTEAFADWFHGEGYTVASSEDFGYPLIKERRKVVLWSRETWTAAIASTRSPTMPPGRYVEGVTTVRGLRLRVHGVCVPWRDAHVKGGRRDAEPWEEHLAYLDALGDRLHCAKRAAAPTIVAGDFNQHSPRKTVPSRVYEPLRQAVTGFGVATSGPHPSPDEPLPIHLIDHILLSPELRCDELRVLSGLRSSGQLSDHPGVFAIISAAQSAQRLDFDRSNA